MIKLLSDCHKIIIITRTLLAMYILTIILRYMIPAFGIIQSSQLILIRSLNREYLLNINPINLNAVIDEY